MTDDVGTLASQVIALAAMKKKLAELDADVRERLQMAMDRGDRKAGRAGEAKIGTVTLTDPETTWRIADKRAWLEWVKAHKPTEIVTTESVNTAYESAFLASLDPSLGLPDGVELVTGPAVVQVRPAPDAMEAIAAELAKAGLTVGQWLESFSRKEIQS